MEQERQRERRVRAWAVEIARVSGAHARAVEEIERLAGSYRLSDEACRKLADDLRIELVNPSRRSVAGDYRAIVEAAEVLDSQLEFAPYGGAEAGALIDRLMAEYPSLANLRRASRADLKRALPKLPVYPAAAARTLQQLADPDVCLPDVEKIAAYDQVLAGRLISVANCAYFAPEERIGTIARAILHIGLPNARRVVTAEAMRPVFGSKRMRALWLHSMQSAKVAERVAEISGAANAGEAFLAGLVHDIGRLAIVQLPEVALEACDRVIAAGCEQLSAETVLFGFDHAEAGEVVLRRWNFPPAVAAAVRYHHAPELTEDALASVLYLTEFWTESDEEAPSNVRLRHAEKMTGVSVADLAFAKIGRRDVVDELVGVA